MVTAAPAHIPCQQQPDPVPEATADTLSRPYQSFINQTHAEGREAVSQASFVCPLTALSSGPQCL